MRRLLLIVSLLSSAVLLSACQSTTPAASAASPSRLDSTPRHDEWVQIAQGDRTVHAYVVYPQTSTKAPVMIVIHENRGLTDWVRTVADRLAENGYIVIAPDLLSGMAPGAGRTSDFASEDAARTAIGALPKAQVAADLDAVYRHAVTIPSTNGSVSVAGFCWGGSQAWNMAMTAPQLTAAYVFYGTAPQDPEGFARIGAPVYAFYGGNDERVNATIPATEEQMRKAGKHYEPVIYPGAGHAFMRSGESPSASAADRDAARNAWSRWMQLLRNPSATRRAEGAEPQTLTVQATEATRQMMAESHDH
jgi:carboxymethylenebutenolidase